MEKPKTIRECPFIQDDLTKLMEHPTVRATFDDLVLDFEKAYATLLEMPIPDDADENLLFSARVEKTKTFHDFVTGCLYGMNPEGEFHKACVNLVARPSQEPPVPQDD